MGGGDSWRRNDLPVPADCTPHRSSVRAATTGGVESVKVKARCRRTSVGERGDPELLCSAQNLPFRSKECSESRCESTRSPLHSECYVHSRQTLPVRSIHGSSSCSREGKPDVQSSDSNCINRCGNRSMRPVDTSYMPPASPTLPFSTRPRSTSLRCRMASIVRATLRRAT